MPEKMRTTFKKPEHSINPVRACILLIIIISGLIYWQTKNYGFVSFDDHIYVKDNRYVRAGLTLESITWAFSFSEKESTYWHPLTWLSLMTDSYLYGLNPGMNHANNLIFHILNSILIFLTFFNITDEFWKSAFIAVLFAVHPLNVESVAWITERKNVLSTFFWFLTLWLYGYYVKYPDIYKYILLILIFILGLLSKPMVVTLPCVLLLLDFWPLRRNLAENFRIIKIPGSENINTPISRLIFLILEKTPFFMLSLISICVSSLSLARYDNFTLTTVVPISLRIANALVSYVVYITKIVLPVNLAVFYPYPSFIPSWQSFGSGFLLVLLSGLLIWQYRKKPQFAVGWLWYLVTLAPVNGLLQAGLWPAMADRWLYIPNIGIFIIIAYGIPELFSHFFRKKFLLGITGGLFLLTLAVLAWVQVGYWRDDVKLYQHALDATSRNSVAHNNLGLAMQTQGKHEEAIKHFTEALRIKPDDAGTYNNLGLALADQGKIEEGLKHFSTALLINPNYANAHNNIGFVLASQGKIEEAIIYFLKALGRKPNYTDAHYNLGLALMDQGKFDEAIDHYSKALTISPYDVKIQNNIGVALIRNGKIQAGIKHLQTARQLNSDHTKSPNNLSYIENAKP
jgi:protein O-mannosyl-transferase